MNIEQMRARLVELHARATDGSASEAELAETSTLAAQITEYASRAKAASAAIALATEGTPVVDERVSGSYGQRFMAAVKGYTGSGATREIEYPVFQTRAFIGTADLALPAEDHSNIVVIPNLVTPLVNVVNVEPVSIGTAYWHRVQTNVDGTGVVAEGNAAGESTYVLTPQSASMETLRAFANIQDSALEDMPNIAAKIDNLLTRGIKRHVDMAIAASIVGPMANPAIVAFTGTNSLDAIRLAIADLENNMEPYAPNAVLMNPADAAKVDMSILAITTAGPKRYGEVWNLPIVTSPLVAPGTAYVGDFKAAITYFIRRDVTLQMSDSHAGNFVAGQLTLSARARGHAAIVALPAIRKVTL